jgi:hypothetical protein
VSPERWEVACENCPRLVDTRVETVYQRASGWVKKRQQGGSNALALPELETRFMCTGCMDRAKRGIDPDQRSLL